MSGEHLNQIGTSSEPVRVKKFCKACTDFKSWMKQKYREQTAYVEPSENPGQRPLASDTEKATADSSEGTSAGAELAHECPLARDELGRQTWGFLHTMAAYYPEQADSACQKKMQNFLGLFANFYPCEDCAEGLREDMKSLPPCTETQECLAVWMCRIHNAVNRRLGKPEFDCAKVNERWRDGWPDDSCD